MLLFEIRASGGDVCESCGAAALAYSGGRPIAADVAAVLEREIVRRELAMVKLMRDAVRTMTAEQVEQVTAAVDAGQVALGVVGEQLAGTIPSTPSRWHPVRRRRERIFRERLAPVLAELGAE